MSLCPSPLKSTLGGSAAGAVIENVASLWSVASVPALTLLSISILPVVVVAVGTVHRYDRAVAASLVRSVRVTPSL